MLDPDTIECRAGDLLPGDYVDLESIPATADHPLASFELAAVLSADPDGDRVALSIDGVGPVIYCGPDDVVRVGPNRPAAS